MQILPQFLPFILLACQAALYQKVAESCFAELLAHARNNLLCKIDKYLDLRPIEEACADFHHSSGPGRPAEYTISLLVRALLVGYLYQLSLRELEERLYTDLAARQFIGCKSFEPIPDHTTLERFELWVIEHQPRIYCDTVMRQIDQRFPSERQKVQVGDTYAMLAFAAEESLTPRLQHVCLRLLREMSEALPVPLERWFCGYEWNNLVGVQPEKPSEFLPKEARLGRLNRTALAAADFQRRVSGLLQPYPQQAYPLIRKWAGYLGKVLGDEIRFEYDAQGQPVQASELLNDDKGEFRLISATDPEATYRMHGDEPEDITLGYNVQVAATTSGFIRETRAYTGAVPDQAKIAELVSEQVTHLGTCPPKLLYDQAGGAGKTRFLVQQASQGQTLLVAKIPDLAQRNQRFGPYDFTLSADGHSLTCPHDKTSTICYPSPGEGQNFRFFAWQCWQDDPPKRMKNADLSKRCPLWEECRDLRQGPGSMRQVFISDYREQVLAAHSYNESEVFRKEMKQRPMIERIISELTNCCGARRCRRRGVEKADWQAKMCATVCNLRLWMRKERAAA
jgi:hypothetical protein